MRPSALSSRRPAPSLAPIVATRPSITPMSARKTSEAVASVPLRTTRSYSAIKPVSRSMSDRTDIGLIHALQASVTRKRPSLPAMAEHGYPLVLGDGAPAAVGAFFQAFLEAGQQAGPRGGGEGVQHGAAGSRGR